MKTRNPFLNLIIGPTEIASRIEYKYAVLRGQLSFLLGFICLVFIPIDMINGVTDFVPWYLFGIVASFILIYLNREQKYKIATILLLVVANLLIYFFAAVDNPQSGVFFFFTAAALMGIIFFHQTSWVLALTFSVISVLLALMAFFWDWSPIPPPMQTIEHIQMNFVTNLILGMTASILVLMFVMNRNRESEQELLQQQEKFRLLANELETSKNRFASAVEGSSAGIYEWGIDDGSIFVSAQWLKLLGYEEGEIDINLESYMGLIHPDDLGDAEQMMREALSSKKPYQNELRLRRKDGSYHWFLDSGIVKYSGGKPVLASGSIQDINDRKNAQQELQRKNEELEKINSELDRFVYSASHDMRAPLSTLLGLIQLAQRAETGEELKQYFEMMTDRINTMEGFIREVTDFSRNARLDLEIKEINLSELINEVIESFEFLSKQSDVQVEVLVDRQYTIKSDDRRLRVIFSNLLSNAIKYYDRMKKDRWVQLNVRCEQTHCLIEVKDNGIGINDQLSDEIFDMFYRASEISDGSGLGLYIVRETLEKLGGSITYNSSKENTSFEVRLPYQLGEEMA